MMLDIYEMDRWTKDHNLILNRMSIVNQLHGCRYDNARGNPMALRYAHGTYELMYYDSTLATYGIWDLPGVAKALEVASSWSGMVWLVSRAGHLRKGDF